MGRAAGMLAAVGAAFAFAGAVAWVVLRPAGTAPESAPVPVRAAVPRPKPAPSPAPPRPAPRVDPALPVYAPREKVKGRIRSVGSDTMNNEMTLWAEGVRRYHPDFWIEIEGKGSSTATPALIAGRAEFGPMSRAMKPREVEEFRRKFGHGPVALATSIDMLAVFVHRDNPLRGMTLPQVDAVFSKGRKGGHPTDIRTWGDLGLAGEWADRPIRLYGRNSASGTWGYFKERALLTGDYKDSVVEKPGSSSVVQGVAGDRYGIGYSGIGYKTADVKAVSLAAKPGQPFVEAVPANADSGAYPLSRFLLLHVNRAPGESLDPSRREFLLYVFSRQGQEDVVRDGYHPLTAALAREQLAKVGLVAAAGEESR